MTTYSVTISLIISLLMGLPDTPRTRCVADRAEEIATQASESAERHHVPPAILLSIGWLESALACDPRSGGSWGSPINRTHRHTAGTSDHAASAIALGYSRCRSWLDAVRHFRTGRCRGVPPVGYGALAAMHLAQRIDPSLR